VLRTKDAIYYKPEEVQPMLQAANDLYVQTRNERDEALTEAEHFRAALKLEVSDNQKERDQINGRLRDLEARVYDLEHSHHYIIEELRAMMKPTAPSGGQEEG
jgi:hypothetical protein